MSTTLIITEKPQAALKIAAALSAGKDKKYSEKGVAYYEFEKNGKNFVVGCAVGHLFGIAQKEKRATVPNFNVGWRPNYEKKGSEYTKKYFNVLKKLAKRADDFIVASDYDIEGEVIGWNVVRFICNQKDAKRMKFSSLTKDELDYSFDNISKTINWGQAIAGETRHYLDWFYGINLSRELMKCLTKTGKFKILSIGRIQGPALTIIVEKELQIKKFKATPYWQVFLLVQDIKKQKLEVSYPKDITKKGELLKFKQLKGKKGIVKTKIKEESIAPPVPFDLTTLQTESYKHFNLTPTQTLQIAQKLYLEGVISYPRTSSQKYPEAIGYKKILRALGKNTKLVKYAVNENPVEGKKSDPAHPAIYPTGEFKKIEGHDKKLYDLIVRRFIATFCNPAVVENKKVEVAVNNLKFSAKGLKIKEKNWMNVYKSNAKESDIPTMEGEADINEIRIEEKLTQPPKRYSEASLVKELEKRNLGTKATRAGIIDTLYSRNYIKERSIEATPLGMKMVETLKKFSPVILDEELTRELEKEMGSIQTANKNLEGKQKKIMDSAKKSITKIVEDMKKNDVKIGKLIAEANSELWEQEKQDNTLNKCPVCKEGDLRILYNRKSRRFFVACGAYPNCRNTYSLPPNSLIKPAKEDCKICSFPMLISIRKGKRPWKFCFNPECESRKEYRKKGAD